ncbi:MAG: hypothetical protein EBZ47_03080 [Chlamydiae bacterium]|nr:hypothetical protein [Chlamydiota bacterium]
MQTKALQKRSHLSLGISCTLMVAGTTIGAGMLGMPLATAKAGFWPAVGMTIMVWAFMLTTGLLLLEVCLKVPQGKNILSLSKYFWGNQGKGLIGSLFAFLYYCLLVAYFAAGSLLISSIFQLPSFISLVMFCLIFGGVVSLGPKWIDKVNFLLTLFMFSTYALLIYWGGQAVDLRKLTTCNMEASLLATPVLFSAFGYHNVIPSLANYVSGNKKVLRISLIAGTTIALIVFLLWQWIIIGSIPQDALGKTMQQGLPVTAALQVVLGRPEIFIAGQCFAFFALTTSLLGVCFSMVDFLAEIFHPNSRWNTKEFLTLCTFIPPFICVCLNPHIFDKALGVAGGIGEAFLNGFIPIAFFTLIKLKNDPLQKVASKQWGLGILVVFCTLVFAVEVFDLFR